MRARTFLLSTWILISVASAWGASRPALKLLHQALAFEPNRGQTSPETKYLARGSAYTIFITSKDAVLRLKSVRVASDSSLRLRWVSPNPSPVISNEQQLPGRVNYLRGNDSSRWLTDIPTYGRIRLASIYKDIDLLLYGNQRRLEYDFVVAPGGDPKQIALAFEGASELKLDSNGDLILSVNGGELRQHKPIVYQVIGGKKKMIEARFLLAKDNTASFSLGEYDHGKPLVIDPTLSYSTYLGGSGDERGTGIAVDSSGRAYVSGVTDSTDFPVKGGVQSNNRGGTDVFVTKMWATGGGVIYSTYIGGSGNDGGLFHSGIAVDRFGNAYVAGQTDSADFPGTLTGPGGNTDAFALKLNAAGNALLYSVRFGSSAFEQAHALALDSDGNVYVTGLVGVADNGDPNDFPTTPGAFDTTWDCDVHCGFVTKLGPTGEFVYSGFIDGNRLRPTGIGIDGSRYAYVTGDVWSGLKTTAGAFMETPPLKDVPCGICVVTSAFVTKISPRGKAVVYSTYLGGNDSDSAEGIAVLNGRAYVTGATFSTNFPTTSGAFRRTKSDGIDVFVTKFNSAGSGLVYSTYLGGSGADRGNSIAVNSLGHAYVTGTTSSANFPVKNAVDSSYNGGLDVFVTKLWATGGGLHYSTFLGGSTGPAPGTGGDDEGLAIRLDANNNAYITGYTLSSDFRTTSGAFQRTLKGQDAFVAKIAP
jgi:hypothetical protein